MKFIAILAAGLAAEFCNLQASAQVVLYDNLAPDGWTSIYQSAGDTHEWGDQVTLAAGTPRVVDSFSFQYFAENLSGNEAVEVRFYKEDGTPNPSWPTVNTPGTVIYDSGPLPITQVNTRGLFNLNNLNLSVPDTFVWTVQFTGVAVSDTTGTATQHPPTIGSSYDDFWERNNSVWSLAQIGGNPTSFGAQISAVPEPASAAVAVGLGLLGCVAWRRVKATYGGVCP